jgi:hypothetical protein
MQEFIKQELVKSTTLASLINLFVQTALIGNKLEQFSPKTLLSLSPSPSPSPRILVS